MQKAIIIGGGLVGMSAALALSKANISVDLLDKSDMLAHKDPKLDGRTIALADSSIRFFKELRIWDELAQKAGPIKEIRVADEFSPAHLHFNCDEVGAESFGFMVNITDIVDALQKHIALHKNIKIHKQKSLEKIVNTENYAKIICEDGAEFEANLLIAADGRGSKVREELGIKSLKKDYGQTAIVCNIRHELAHDCVALEHFFPSGPFAVLPMKDAHISGIVWAVSPDAAPQHLESTEDEFLAEIQQRMGGYLGEIKLATDRFSYPLRLNHARSYSAKRTVIVGDAAHGVHPIAGQGVNLGFRDIIDLTKILAKHAKIGMDIGSTTCVKEYERSRKLENFAMVAGMDNLDRLFSNELLPLKLLRRTGLAAVAQIPQLKRFFMKKAMG